MWKRIRRFHDDEAGLSAIQVVLIAAIAAVFLGLIKFFWRDVKNFFAVTVFPLIGFGKD